MVRAFRPAAHKVDRHLQFRSKGQHPRLRRCRLLHRRPRHKQHRNRRQHLRHCLRAAARPAM